MLKGQETPFHGSYLLKSHRKGCLRASETRDEAVDKEQFTSHLHVSTSRPAMPGARSLSLTVLVIRPVSVKGQKLPRTRRSLFGGRILSDQLVELQATSRKCRSSRSACSLFRVRYWMRLAGAFKACPLTALRHSLEPLVWNLDWSFCGRYECNVELGSGSCLGEFTPRCFRIPSMPLLSIHERKAESYVRFRSMVTEKTCLKVTANKSL